ncbi:hypothetical protein ACWGE0_22115 [Lentzea sp. NPDC054927]
MTEDPRSLLTELAAVRKRARADRHGYWLPFLLFGLITLGATPFYGPEFCDATMNCSWSVSDEPWLWHWLHPTGKLMGPVLGFDEPGIAADIYWIVALLCGYLAVVWWYRWRAAQVGVETSTRLYAQVTIFMLVLPLIGVPVLSELFFGRVGWQIALPVTVVAIVAATWRMRSIGFTLAVLVLFALAHFVTVFPFGPMVVLAAGLAVLAYLERSTVCTVTVAIFSAVVLFVNVAGQFFIVWPYSVENFASTALPAAVLLIGGTIGSVRREMAR